MKQLFEIGEKVKDTVSGLSGIIVQRTEYLNGCARVGVQPDKLNKEGKPYDVFYFDEPQCKLVKPRKKLKRGQTKTGGPRLDPIPK